MEDLISVVVPVYNVENYLEICLDSIIGQTYKNLDIILIDDGSMDKSGSICDIYAKKDKRIRVFHKENGGLSDARNFGIKEALGKFILFIDSDDFIDKGMIKYLYNLIKRYNSDIGICDCLHYYAEEKCSFTKGTRINVFTAQQAIEEMFYQKSFLVSACGKIFRTDYFKNTFFPYGKIFEDSAIMYRIFEKANYIAYSDAKLYAYVHRENSITTNNFNRSDLDILGIVDEIMEYANIYPKLKKSARAYYITGNLRVFLNADPLEEYKDIIEKCKMNIKREGWKVFLDKNIRNKLRYSLILFLLGRKIMKDIYSKVNRWS